MKFSQIKDELVQATNSIDKLEEELTIFFEALPDPIFIIDEHGKYLETLAGNATEFYLDISFLRGQYIDQVFSPELSSTLMATIKKTLDSQKLTLIEYQISENELQNKACFEPNWFQGRVVPLNTAPDENKAVAWIAVNISERKRLEKKLLELSVKDELTGLYNRRYIHDDISKRIASFARYNTPFSIAFIDIDYFKKINDRYGHDAGDEVLKALSDLVQSELRNSDIFARFGGEEFIAVFPNTSKKDAAVFVERLRNTIQEQRVETTSGSIAFTISIGLTEVIESDKAFDTIVKRADEALYIAKEKGRNCLVIS